MSATGDARERGMTLLEVLVVVAITVLVGGLMFPNLQRSLSRLGAAQAEAALGADLRQARAAAVRGGAAVRLQASADGRAYQVQGRPVRQLSPGLALRPAGSGVVYFADGSMRGRPWRLVRTDAAPGPARP